MEWVRYWLVGNGFAITTSISLMAINDLRETVVGFFSNSPAMGAAFAGVTEGAILASAFLYMHLMRERGRNKDSEDADPFEGLAFDEVTIRFANPNEYEGLISVFLQYFPGSFAFDPEEYRLLMQSGRHLVRTMSGKLPSGDVRILGFYSVWPMRSEVFDALASGKLKEKHLTSSVIEAFDCPEADVLYIAEVAIARGQPFGRALMLDAKSYLLNIIHLHPQFKRVGAWGYSATGRRLASRMGLREIKRKNGKGSGYFEVSAPEMMRALRPDGMVLAQAPPIPFLPVRRIKLSEGLEPPE